MVGRLSPFFLGFGLVSGCQLCISHIRVQGNVPEAPLHSTKAFSAVAAVACSGVLHGLHPNRVSRSQFEILTPLKEMNQEVFTSNYDASPRPNAAPPGTNP